MINAQEVVQAGREIYYSKIQPVVEPDQIGKFIVIDISSGEYEIDSDDMAASERMVEKHPSGERCLLRIGYRTTARIGYCRASQ